MFPCLYNSIHELIVFTIYFFKSSNQIQVKILTHVLHVCCNCEMERFYNENALIFKWQLIEEKWEFNEEFFKKMPYLKSCVMEAIRLHSVGVITRRVMTSFTVRVSIIVSVVSYCCQCCCSLVVNVQRFNYYSQTSICVDLVKMKFLFQGPLNLLPMILSIQ